MRGFAKRAGLKCPGHGLSDLDNGLLPGHRRDIRIDPGLPKRCPEPDRADRARLSTVPRILRASGSVTSTIALTTDRHWRSENLEPSDARRGSPSLLNDVVAMIAAGGRETHGQLHVGQVFHLSSTNCAFERAAFGSYLNIDQVPRFNPSPPDACGKRAWGQGPMITAKRSACELVPLHRNFEGLVIAGRAVFRGRAVSRCCAGRRLTIYQTVAFEAVRSTTPSRRRKPAVSSNVRSFTTL